MTSFTTLYKKLNKEQKEAVDTIEGPLMIIAGPGTGKTLTLTMRIANILKKTDTKASSILALTFTESGARTMRERLVEIIGPTAYYVNISTFHSFCTDVLNEFSEEFLFSEDTTPLSELERIQLFKEILDEGEFEILRPLNSRYFYINDLIKNIQNLKRENVTVDKFSRLIEDDEKEIKQSEKKINPRTKKPYTKYARQERELAKQKELLKIYRAYQSKLSEMKRYDFEDMISLVVNKLKRDENLKLSLQEKYLYLLVDEYQDTNSSQNEIIRLLTDHWEDPNIFVVGDDEQSIYRFQGASLENVIYFKKLFKKGEIINLSSSYRSTQYILDASRSLIERNILKLSDIVKKLKSHTRTRNSPITVAKFSTSEIENSFIAEEVNKLIKKGTDPDQIALLVRHNRDIEDIKDALNRQNIRYEITSGKNILNDSDINKLLLLLEVIYTLQEKPSDDIDIFTLLSYEFLKFDSLDILKLAKYASEKSENLLDAILSKDIFNETDIKRPEGFIDFANKLARWKSIDANTTFINFFEKVILESGFLDWVLADKYNTKRVNILNSLFNEIKKLNFSDHSLNLEKFLENIELMRENNIAIPENPIEADSDTVKLITAHRAKGLEFQYVFITKCVDKKWGNNRQIEKIKLPQGIIRNVNLDKKEKNEDERRLFYVAMTRAKKKIYITYAEKYSTYGYSKETAPSMFISEIDAKYTERMNTSNYEKIYSKTLINQLKLPDSSNRELEETDFLNSLIGKFKLSVTALNTYLKCPYKFKLNNILRTPRAKASYLVFGTAVHKALEIFFQKYKKSHRAPSVKLLINSYQSALKAELLSEKDMKSLEQRGKRVLKEYYKVNHKSFKEPLFTEYSFGFRRVYLDDIPLAGKIDKVELLDKGKREVKVIDYKTGTPKSRGEIEGKTKYSDGDLIRQLNFYKVLAQLDKNFNYTVSQGEFDFLESKSGKKAKKESYTYSPTEIEDLKNLVRKSMEKIRNLEFDRTKEYRHCQNCDYRNHCWPEGIP